MALEMIGLAEVLFLASREQSTAYTIAWIIVILILPVFGIVLYLMWEEPRPIREKAKESGK